MYSLLGCKGFQRAGRGGVYVTLLPKRQEHSKVIKIPPPFFNISKYFHPPRLKRQRWDISKYIE